MGVLAEDLVIGLEAHLGAAPVEHAADGLELGLRQAAGEDLPIEGLAARHLDLEGLGEGVHHRDADAVQAAGGLVDLRIELSARMQRGHDDLERRLLREFRVRIDRDAAAVVGHGEPAAFLQLHLDEGRVSGDRLVHGIVDHLGEEVVQGLLVRAADIHARAAADGLEPFQHLDGGRVIAGLAGRALLRGRAGHLDGGVASRGGRGPLGSGAPEEIVVVCHWDLGP